MALKLILPDDEYVSLLRKMMSASERTWELLERKTYLGSVWRRFTGRLRMTINGTQLSFSIQLDKAKYLDNSNKRRFYYVRCKVSYARLRVNISRI